MFTNLCLPVFLNHFIRALIRLQRVSKRSILVHHDPDLLILTCSNSRYRTRSHPHSLSPTHPHVHAPTPSRFHASTLPRFHAPTLPRSHALTNPHFYASSLPCVHSHTHSRINIARVYPSTRTLPHAFLLTSLLLIIYPVISLFVSHTHTHTHTHTTHTSTCPSIHPSIHPSFLPSLPPFLPSFLPSFPLLPSFLLPSFLPSFLPFFPFLLLFSFLPSLLSTFFYSFLPCTSPTRPGIPRVYASTRSRVNTSTLTCCIRPRVLCIFCRF